MKEVPVWRLHEMFDYDPELGVLRWKHRPQSHFATAKGMKIFNAAYAGEKAGTPSPGRYILIRITHAGHSKKIQGHRIAWAMMKGVWPTEQMDHINGVKTDNRMCNLRVVGQLQNTHNVAMYKNNTSGVTGVARRKNGYWYARIQVEKRAINLAITRDFTQAVAARKAAEIHYGFHENHGKTADVRAAISL